MGSASSQVSTTSQTVVDKVFDQCSAPLSANQLTLSNVNFNPNPLLCKGQNTDFDIEQKAAVNAQCFIDASQTGLAQALATQDAKAQQGLGFAVSTNENENSQNISSYLTNACTGASATNTANLTNINVSSCNYHNIQSTDAKSACKINAIQDIANKIDANQTAASTGLTLASLFTGYGNTLTTLAIIAGIVFVIYMAFKLFSGKSTTKCVVGQTKPDGTICTEAESKGGFLDYISNLSDPQAFSKSLNKSGYSFVTIILILVLVIVFINIIPKTPVGKVNDTINPENLQLVQRDQAVY